MRSKSKGVFVPHESINLENSHQGFGMGKMELVGQSFQPKIWGHFLKTLFVGGKILFQGPDKKGNIARGGLGNPLQAGAFQG